MDCDLTCAGAVKNQSRHIMVNALTINGKIIKNEGENRDVVSMHLSAM